MSDHIGSGYGSEFHLMRTMGRYRNAFDQVVSSAIGGTVLKWLDMKHGGVYDTSNPAKVILPDIEYKGIDFLPKAQHEKVERKWQEYWPRTGNVQNWDSVGRIQFEGTDYWLLVEAKAHKGEIKSDCHASSPRSLETIDRAFTKTKEWLGLEAGNDWRQLYYQAANRLAMLHFLNEICGIPAKMLCIYFCGDQNPNADCPKDACGWRETIRLQDEHLGITLGSKAKAGWHTVFWDVMKGAVTK